MRLVVWAVVVVGVGGTPSNAPSSPPSIPPSSPSLSPLPPTVSPSLPPTISPLPPTVSPSLAPTNPTTPPTLGPTSPTTPPTQSPSSSFPTSSPSLPPTLSPSNPPSVPPTLSPTSPTTSPTGQPSRSPSRAQVVFTPPPPTGLPALPSTSPSLSPVLLQSTATLVATATGTASSTLPTMTPQVRWGGPMLLVASLTRKHYVVDVGDCSVVMMLDVGPLQRSASSVYAGCPSCAVVSSTADSVFNRGRVGSTGWFTAEQEGQHWYQFNFPVSVRLAGIVVTPSARSAPPPGPDAKWVTTVTLATSNGSGLVAMDGGTVFDACDSANCRKFIRADAPVVGHTLRVDIAGWKWWPAMCLAPVLCGWEQKVNETITLTFSSPTKQGTKAAEGGFSDAPTSSQVDFLFEVSEGTLGLPAGYVGQWTSASTFVITLTSSFDGELTPGVSYFRLKESSGISSVSGELLSQQGAAVPLTEFSFSEGREVDSGDPTVKGFLTEAPEAGKTRYLLIMGFILGAIAIIVFILLLMWCIVVTCARRGYANRIHKGLRHANEYHKARQIPTSPTSPPANPLTHTFPPAGRY
eukprot:Hpha_TRINITY_DN27144_c0_g1::TRINITY_DN27144_c0_g1_i1::g.29261::m.29261